MDKFFCTLPVYRVTEEKYYKDREKYLEESLYLGCDTELTRQFFAENPSQKTMAEEHLIFKYGGPWEFNEVIGYIKLHFVGTQIRGEYWSVEAKKIVRTRKKIFKYRTHKLATEKSVDISSNSNIYDTVVNYIESCKKELKGRYVDDSLFLTTGKFIDWKSLINSEAEL